MTEKFTLDRIEKGTAVCISFIDERVLHLPESFFSGFSEGDIFEIEFEKEKALCVKFLKEETESAKKKAENRLEALFLRSKNKKDNT